jgi:SAM-dependent methyltransferase
MQSIDGLQCIICRTGNLQISSDLLTCSYCGQEHLVVGGVPVMFETVLAESGPFWDDRTARDVLAAFELSDDALSVLRMRDLLRRRVRFGNALIQIESRQFLHRVRNSGHRVETVATAHRSGVADEATRDFTTMPRYRLTGTYLPRRMPPGQEFLANVRLENAGAVPLYKDGAGRTLIAQRWQTRDGAPVAAPDLRTPIPIDLPPGHAVTIAAGISPPSRPGAYLLSLLLVQEQIRWLEAEMLTIPIVVGGQVPGSVPDGWTVLLDPPADYDTDHVLAFEIMREWLDTHAPPRPRVLEVGGNAAPILARLNGHYGANLVNVDVDLLGLQVGRLVARKEKAAVQFLCADAFDLPFASGYFDAIVIFASLHHFPDPAALLANLAHKLRRGGFIGLFCEPVGHVWPGAVTPEFLAELERGVNEQSFSLREYELMFKRAELMPAEVRVDMNSLKARLVHNTEVASG